MALEQTRERAVDEPDALLELGLLMLLRRRERAFEVVDEEAPTS